MPDGTRRDGPGYDEDFYAWTQYQAEVLRAMPCVDNRFDRDHVAEEIEDLGRSYRDAARSQIKRILSHLLKLAYSPAGDPRYGWMTSISDAREAVEAQLSATLRRDLEASLPLLYRRARKDAELSLREFGEHDSSALLPLHCP